MSLVVTLDGTESLLVRHPEYAQSRISRKFLFKLGLICFLVAHAGSRWGPTILWVSNSPRPVRQHVPLTSRGNLFVPSRPQAVETGALEAPHENNRVPVELISKSNQEQSWRLFGGFMYVGAALLGLLLLVRRWTITPIVRAVRSIFGFGKSSPRFNTNLAPQSELGITVPGMMGPLLVKPKAYPVNPAVNIKDITNPVLVDLVQLQDNLTSLVGASNPRLREVAKQIFGAGGKRLRPVIVFLVARATTVASGMGDLLPQHRRLAEVIEMIHTASLLHDDVVDNSDTRRGAATAHQRFGTSVAILAGDYMFAQSSWYLACLENLTVIKLISRVIADFADGEVAQAGKLFDPSITMDDYLDKSFNKTGTLIAAACKSAAVFSEMSPNTCDLMYNYGKHLGLAFQVVDDILDFTQDSETLGKPAGSDLASGNITAPTLFAFDKNPELRQTIATRFVEEGSLEKAIDIVKTNGGITAAEALAKKHGDLAKACLEELPDSPYKTSLQMMVDYILSRIY
eukprot:EG_transcript_8132